MTASLNGSRTRICLLLALALTLMLGACNSYTDSSSLISEARNAYSTRNYVQAQAICDTVARRVSAGEKLYAADACQVALLLMHLSDVPAGADANENTAMACSVLRSVSENHPDSIRLALREFAPEEQGILLVLSNLNMPQDSVEAASREFPDEYQPGADSHDDNDPLHDYEQQ